MLDKIFVQIAAYRDPELLPTIRDCIAQAKRPENLRFGIAWQHAEEDEWDTLAEFENDSRFRILDIPYLETKGTCWARYQIQQLWEGEEYTLQLDSHHRFERGWDSILINMIEDLQSKGHDKPLLTTYVTSYTPSNDPAGREPDPWYLTFDRFTPQGAVFFRPAPIPEWKKRRSPYPTRFYSAHFAFTLGQFCEEVPHDPNLLFHGEEITIAARAYTWGYDLFAPHRLTVYHEYTREHRPKKSWDDIREWGKWDHDSLARTRAILGVDGEKDESLWYGKFGYGTVRTLADYEEYAGIRFENRSVQQHTLEHRPLPNPPEEESPFIRLFSHCIDMPFEWFPHNDYTFWAVAFEDENGEEIIRLDVGKEEVQDLLTNPAGYVQLWRHFVTDRQPRHWVVWPHSEEHGWGERLTGELY